MAPGFDVPNETAAELLRGLQEAAMHPDSHIRAQASFGIEVGVPLINWLASQREGIGLHMAISVFAIQVGSFMAGVFSPDPKPHAALDNFVALIPDLRWLLPMATCIHIVLPATIIMAHDRGREVAR